MNASRIVLGGIVGGVAFNVLSILVNVVVLADRYSGLQAAGRLRADARLPFLPLWVPLLFGVSGLLVWLYAAARPRLGPGPRTALCVGLTVGVIAALPHAWVNFCWTYLGGFVSMWGAIEMVAGCAIATLVGAWLYRE